MIARRCVLAGLGAVLADPARAQFLPGLLNAAERPSNDPYTLAETTNGAAGFANASGRTPVDGRRQPGERTLVLVLGGQSYFASTVNDSYLPTNSRVHNFSIYDGGTYACALPLLGCSTGLVQVAGAPIGHFGLRLADKLINAAVCQRVILVPIAVNATSISDWATGGVLNSRLTVTMSRLAASGLTPDAFLWDQGTNDYFYGTTQAAWQSGFASVVSTLVAAGMRCPIFVASSSYYPTLMPTTSATIEAAQAAVINHAATPPIWVGGNQDSIGAGGRQAGGHENATGADSLAGLWQTALHAYGAPF